MRSRLVWDTVQQRIYPLSELKPECSHILLFFVFHINKSSHEVRIDLLFHFIGDLSIYWGLIIIRGAPRSPLRRGRSVDERSREEDRFEGAGFFDAPDFYKSNAMNFQALSKKMNL